MGADGVGAGVRVAVPDGAAVVAAEGSIAGAAAASANGAPAVAAAATGAAAATCTHVGGPLDEGERDGTCVQCPWHGSVFDLRDGRVIHGPATSPIRAYETRISESGQVEVRPV